MSICTAPNFWDRVDLNGDGGCWLYTSFKNKGGYGTFNDGHGKNHLAHRWAYKHLIGEIPPGHHLDHLCRVRNCINPNHLEPITPGDHARRTDQFHGRNGAATHCPQGHAYDEKNTYRAPKTGNRTCKTCARATQRDRSRRYEARIRAGVIPAPPGWRNSRKLAPAPDLCAVGAVLIDTTNV